MTTWKYLVKIRSIKERGGEIVLTAADGFKELIEHDNELLYWLQSR